MTGNATPESRTMTEPKEIKLFDLKTDKRYAITAISKSNDVGPTNGLFFILEGNLKLYLSVVDLFSDSKKLISCMSYMTLFHIFLIKSK
jgi:tricorn protease-like protein